VTSDAGLILVRELDERLATGLEQAVHAGRSTAAVGLQPVAGYEDLNDAERLAADPTFRLISSQRIWDRGTALTSILHRFETELSNGESHLPRPTSASFANAPDSRRRVWQILLLLWPREGHPSLPPTLRAIS
jgi:hypothetical protein